MTDTRRSTTEWLTVAVLAPATAGALAVGTGWALAHPPRDQQSVTAGSAMTVADEPDALPDRTEARLHQRALAAQDRVAHLTRTLHRLRARADALRSAPLPGASSSGVAATPAGGTVSVPAPPVPAAPAPATHTSTGAS
jgi:outer membrane protein TolC